MLKYKLNSFNLKNAPRFPIKYRLLKLNAVKLGRSTAVYVEY